MGAEGLRRQTNMTAHIESRGEDTTLNGETIAALWQDAEVARVQLFLHETEWGIDSFELRLPYYALAAPYSIKNGMQITRAGLNWRGVLRGVTVERSNNESIQVNAIALLVPD